MIMSLGMRGPFEFTCSVRFGFSWASEDLTLVSQDGSRKPFAHSWDALLVILSVAGRSDATAFIAYATLTR
jgi:hypothetical protein